MQDRKTTDKAKRGPVRRDSDLTALVGAIERDGVSFALTDSDGVLREDTIRSYAADAQATISAALMAFKQDVRLASLPRRCSLAVAGVARGDTISVTSSRWFISRSGLAAVLEHEPLVLNDFAAIVWALGAARPCDIEPAGDVAPASGTGTFAVIGTCGGFGAAAFTRNDKGVVTVLATETGHCELIDDSPELAPVAAVIRHQNRTCSAETFLSPAGLAAMHNAIASLHGSPARFATGDEVVRSAESGDPQACRAVELFAKTLWRFAGNLVLIYGAWDGIFMTGPIVNALRPELRRPENRQRFVIGGPYANLLRDVPCAFLRLDHPALQGAAEAIRRQAEPAAQVRTKIRPGSISNVGSNSA